MSKEELSVFIPMRLKKRGGRKMVLVPEGKTQNASIDSTLVKALVRAHLWQRQLKSGKYQTLQDLCDANKVTRGIRAADPETQFSCSKTHRCYSFRPPTPPYEAR